VACTKKACILKLGQRAPPRGRLTNHNSGISTQSSHFQGIAYSFSNHHQSFASVTFLPKEFPPAPVGGELIIEQSYHLPNIIIFDQDYSDIVMRAMTCLMQHIIPP